MADSSITSAVDHRLEGKAEHTTVNNDQGNLINEAYDFGQRLVRTTAVAVTAPFEGAGKYGWKNVQEHPYRTALQVGGAVATGAALATWATEGVILGVAGLGLVGTAFLAKQAFDGIGKSVPELQKVWQSQTNEKNARTEIEKNLGPVVFDAGAMVAGGVAANKATRGVMYMAEKAGCTVPSAATHSFWVGKGLVENPRQYPMMTTIGKAISTSIRNALHETDNTIFKIHEQIGGPYWRSRGSVFGNIFLNETEKPLPIMIRKEPFTASLRK